MSTSELFDLLKPYPFAGSLVSPDGNPSDKLIRVVREFEIQFTETSWTGINEALQNAFFKGTEGTFRYQLARMEQEELTKEQKKDFAPWTIPFKPKLEEYDHILLLGSLLQNTTERLSYFINCDKDNEINCNRIWCLGSERPLIDKEKNDLREVFSADTDVNVEQVTTEASMEVSLIVNLTKFYAWNGKIPANNSEKTVRSFKEGRKFLFINAKGTVKQFATTEDTVNETIKHAEKENISFSKKKILVLSSNPFIEFQCLAVLIPMLKHGIIPQRVDGCGHTSLYPDGKFGKKVIGNNLAKVVYMITQLSKLIGDGK